MNANATAIKFVFFMCALYHIQLAVDSWRSASVDLTTEHTERARHPFVPRPRPPPLSVSILSSLLAYAEQVLDADDQRPREDCEDEGLESFPKTDGKGLRTSFGKVVVNAVLFQQLHP